MIPSDEIDATRLPEQFDVYKILNECFVLLEELSHMDQIGLTHTQDCPETERWDQAFGSLFDHTTKRYPKASSDFCVFNKKLEESYIHKIYSILSHQYGPLGRVRLMRLRPGKCYKIHQDLERRIHIAVNTNENCFFIFENKRLVNIPADGHPYLVNTLRKHTFLNSDKELERLHLVFELACQSL